MSGGTGTVVWVTGLSGAGKTTVSHALRARLRREGETAVCLDGDVIRAAMGDGLGYRENDRRVQISRLQALARYLSAQDLTVIVAALYSHAELLDWNRRNFPRYVEVYLRASLDALRRRDAKGLYAGRPDVVGVDIPWYAPATPDVVLDTDELRPPDELAAAIVAAMAGRRAGRPVGA